MSEINKSNIHQELGQLTRQLHTALNGLGMLDPVKNLAGEIPDARSRLTYIANLTGNAAEKVLNIVDEEKLKHEKLQKECKNVKNWIKENGDVNLDMEVIIDFIEKVKNNSIDSDEKMTSIMMAQDFHDLTTQVVEKVMSLTQNIEQHLVKLVVETAPEGFVDKKEDTNLKIEPLTIETYEPIGPSVDAENNKNVVSNQSEVDDLLASLGF